MTFYYHFKLIIFEQIIGFFIEQLLERLIFQNDLMILSVSPYFDMIV